VGFHQNNRGGAIMQMTNEATRRKNFIITPKNEAAMKQCYERVYRMGMVDNETIKKVRSTDYARR